MAGYVQFYRGGFNADKVTVHHIDLCNHSGTISESDRICNELLRQIKNYHSDGDRIVEVTGKICVIDSSALIDDISDTERISVAGFIKISPMPKMYYIFDGDIDNILYKSNLTRDVYKMSDILSMIPENLRTAMVTESFMGGDDGAALMINVGKTIQNHK